MNEIKIMKNQPLILMTLAIATMASGCKPSTENTVPSDANSTSATQQLHSAREAVTNILQRAKDTTTNAWSTLKAGATNQWADLKDSLEATKDYSYGKKDAFVTSASADLEALDEKIKELSDKAALANDSVKANAQIKLQGLRVKRAALDQKMDAVKNSTEADWYEAKTAFQNSYDDVKNSIKQIWQSMNSQ